MDLAWLTSTDISDGERLERLDSLYALFVSRLVSWNLEHPDGAPIEPTLAGLKSLDNDFGLRIVRSWLFETSAVPRPLDAGSRSGAPSVESSIPMDETSAALVS
jgi:hypothetical protein